jgi:uncharacterized protein
MPRKIFFSLAVKDLKKSMDFFTQLGFSYNPQFTGDDSACMVISEDIFAMLMTHEKFRSFSPKEVCDTQQSNEVLLSISCESREEVTQTAKKAVAAGATQFEEAQDYGFMLQESFIDLDGHGWNLIHMDPNFKPNT